MRAVITVVGKDMVGILAAVSNACAEHKVNIVEVSQSVLQELFCMMMLVDAGGCTLPLASFADIMAQIGRQRQLQIHVMHESVFDTMHSI